MCISLHSMKEVGCSILKKNPTVRNEALSGALEAHIAGFKGRIQISDGDIYSLYSNWYRGIEKPGKIIYISPYPFWTDLFTSIKRIFRGVVFNDLKGHSDLESHLMQGRRITIFCSLDGSEAEAVIETERSPLLSRMYKAIFCC